MMIPGIRLESELALDSIQLSGIEKGVWAPRAKRERMKGRTAKRKTDGVLSIEKYLVCMQLTDDMFRGRC